MQRQTRKEMKHDEFVDTTVVLIQKVQDNPRPYVFGAVAIVVVALGAWGFSSMSKSRHERSAERFSRALAAVNAPVTSELPAEPDDPYRPVFADPASRTAEAVSRLDAAVSAGGPSAKIARFLKGIELAAGGDFDAALAELGAAKDKLGDDPTLGGAVRAAYARTLAAAGRPGEAMAEWEPLTEEGSSYPRDLALLGLAEAAEAAGDTERARSAYKTLRDEFTGSAAAADAVSALSRLGA